jgi:hypothetical protein
MDGTDSWRAALTPALSQGEREGNPLRGHQDDLTPALSWREKVEDTSNEHYCWPDDPPPAAARRFW